MAAQIRIAQDADADEVLSSSPFALLVGMLLDQQYPMEHAFRGPWKIVSRFGTLDPAAIAEAEPEAFAELCATPPAIHRYGRSMAGRVQQLARVVRDEYDGQAERIWTEAADATDLLARLRALPGYGDQKARIFAALLGKRLDVRPAGWQEAIGPYAEDGSFRSVADVVDAESLQKVREFKQAAKAAAKAAKK
jgi:uncharacterized HhH-GPD family protein